MTTHLTHLEDLDGEEPELVLIDDEEFEAAHPSDEDDDEFEPDDSDFEIAFADDLDEAATARTSSQGHGPDADKRMAGLFSAQHEVPAPLGQTDARAQAQTFTRSVAPERSHAPAVAIAGTAVAGAVSTPAPRSRREGKAEEKRQRELLKRRKQMDKAAHEDDKERQRAAKVEAAAAVKEAAAAEKRAAAEAKQLAADDKKREAVEAKQRVVDDKVRTAAAKQRATEEKKRLAEDAKRAAAEAKQRQTETKRRQTETKRRQTEDKRRKTSDTARGFSAAAIMEQARVEEAQADRADQVEDGEEFDLLEPEPALSRSRTDAKSSRRQKGAHRGLLVATAVVIAVVAGGLIYAKTRAHAAAPRSPAAAPATVGSALTSMNKSSTADVTYSMDLSGGQTVTVDGGGNVDLAASSANLSLTYTGNGHTFPEQLVYDGPSAYYDLGLINHYIAPGSYWVQMDLATDRSADPGLGAGGALSDPSSLVALVNAGSASATRVGSTQVDGAPATEYSITENASALARQTNLPSFVRGELALEPFTQVNYEVFVDGSGQVSLIEAVGTLAGSGQPVVVHTTLDVSHLGIPVSVVAPPPAEVVSEQQYESNAQRLANAPAA